MKIHKNYKNWKVGDIGINGAKNLFICLDNTRVSWLSNNGGEDFRFDPKTNYGRLYNISNKHYIGNINQLSEILAKKLDKLE